MNFLSLFGSLSSYQFCACRVICDVKHTKPRYILFLCCILFSGRAFYTQTLVHELRFAMFSLFIIVDYYHSYSLSSFSFTSLFVYGLLPVTAISSFPSMRRREEINLVSLCICLLIFQTWFSSHRSHNRREILFNRP